MGTLKKIEIPKYALNGRRVRGEFEQIVQIVKTPRPFQKQQLIEVVVTLEKATFTKPAVMKREIFRGDFMSVIQKAQAKYQGKTISYRNIDTRPDWLKKEREEEMDRQEAEKAKLAEAQKASG